MGQVLHGSATTTHAIRAAIQRSKASLQALSERLGLVPETVDYSDPALPPGMTAEKVHAGIAVALKQFTDRGLSLIHI